MRIGKRMRDMPETTTDMSR
jgi:hypothetical protein